MRKGKSKKLISKVISAGLALAMMLPCATAFAGSVGSVADDTTVGYDSVQNAYTEYSEESVGSVGTEVYLTVDNANVLVAVPTTVILSGTPDADGNYIGDYSVRVSGDISGDEVVTVEPKTSTVSLTQTGKADETATITQVQTEFDNEDFANNTTTTGQICAQGLTAGSWQGSYNMLIYTTVNYVFYSSVELAAADANNLTTANADVLRSDSANAVAALSISNDSASIRMLQSESDVQSFTLDVDTVLDLNDNTLTFDEGEYVTANAALTVQDGTVTGSDSNYLVYASTSSDCLTVNNSTFTADVSSSITTGSFFVYSKAATTNAYDCSFTCDTVGNSSYNVGGLVLSNSSSVNNTISNCDFDMTVQSPKTLQGIQTQGSLVINNLSMDITSQNRTYGVYYACSSLEISDVDISVTSSSGNALGVYAVSSNTGDTIINSAVVTANSSSATSYGVYIYAGNDSEISDVNITASSEDSSAFGILLINANDVIISGANVYAESINDTTGCGIECNYASSLTINSTDEHPVTVFGKGWGLETLYSGTTTINGGTYTSTDHTCYVLNSADICNANFYIANRDKYDSSSLGGRYGFYCGSSNCSEDAVVNLYNCTIGSSDDSTMNSKYALNATMNYGYTAPAEVNLYDCSVYSLSSQVFSWKLNYLSSDPDRRVYTTFNVYGDTELYYTDSSTGNITLYTANQLASDSTATYYNKITVGTSAIDNLITLGHLGAYDLFDIPESYYDEYTAGNTSIYWDTFIASTATVNDYR